MPENRPAANFRLDSVEKHLDELRSLLVQLQEKLREAQHGNNNKLGKITQDVALVTHLTEELVDKLENITNKLFEGNDPLVSVLAVLEHRVGEQDNRIEKFEKFKWWLIIGLLSSMCTALTALGAFASKFILTK